MTDKSLKVYIGDDRLPVQDLTDYVDWPDSRFIGQAYNGESSVSSVVFRDENARFGPWVDSPVTIAVRNEVEVVHGSNFLYRGRWIGRTWERGVQKAYQAREVTAEAEDVNVELRGLIVDGWERPAETDLARVLALREDYLDGSVRPGSNLATTYVSSSNTQTLPAKTYERTDPLGVLQDVAFQTHKQFFVTIDKELFYDGWDSSAYACSFRITDDEAELRTSPTTTLGIIPDSGPLFAINGQRFIDGVRLYYGAGPSDYVDVTHPGLSSAKAHWRETVYAPESIKTAAEAANLAETILQERSQDGRTFTLSVCHANGGPLTDTQVGSIKPGMLIRIKARVLPYFFANGQPNYAYVTTRIVSLQWHMPLPGQFFATLKLEKPERTFGIGVPPGPQPAGSVPASLIDCGWSQSGAGTCPVVIPDGLSNSMLVAVGYAADDIATHGYPDTADWDPYTGAPEPMTPIPGTFVTDGDGVGSTLGGTGFNGLRMWYLLNPTASPASPGPGNINSAVQSATGGTVTGWWLFEGVDPSNPLGTGVNNGGTGLTSSLTIPGTGIAINAAAGTKYSPHPSAPTVVAGQTLCDTATVGASAMGNGYGDSTPSWTFDVSSQWIACGVTVNGIGSVSTPVDGTGTGSVGTDTGEYSPSDHSHEHANITTGGPYHMAEDVTVVPFSTIAATNVQAALAEIVAEVTGATDHGTLLGLGDDDHTQYVLENILTTGGDMPYATGASTWTRVAIGASNFHLRSDGTKPVWSPEAAGGGMSNPMTTAGDIIKGGAAGTPERLAIGASNFHLISDGATPLWRPIPEGGSGISGIAVEEDGSEEGATITRLNFTTNLDVSVTGNEATISASAGGGLTQAYVGYNTVGGSTEGMTANRVYAKKVTLANACLITDIEAYVDQSGFDDQVGEFHVALFSDSSGTPSRVLAVNAQGGVDYLLLDSASGAGGHNTPRWFGMGLGYWCTAGDYWLAVQVVSNSGLTIRYDGSGSDRYYTAGGFWIADWGWYAPTTSSNTYSIRANTIR
jgi:hypothetical protein